MKSNHIVSAICLALLCSSQAVHAQMRDPAAGNYPAASAVRTDPRSSDDAGESLNRKSFDSLDTSRRGYLTREEAKQDDWAGRNFERCNISHDGHLSEVEYNNCPE